MAPMPTKTLSLTAPAATAAILMAVVMASMAPSAAANEEVKALIALRNGLDDPSGELASWIPDLVDPCTWVRISCNDDNRVNSIQLGNLNITGPLAPELGKLEQLQYMEMAGNNLQGPIPPEFGDLTNLLSMDLYKNNLSGPIPSTIGKLKSLKFLRIDHNRLTGPIPEELTGLSNLVDVDFSSNDFCGTAPTSGVFQTIPSTSFDNNPRLKHPRNDGGDDSSC
ncbi:hypothetical protein EJB05_36081 [Eragrostis curvula]|uniref:Leucine-rich repeat-containing N-terminal plant-type domain-containing protein n=1 Tax=Eragrostis curvula TaxID=38414 RepID=A0A5J9U873_9POAL|nr:hypothetical protein EJB05_36081 [Eragrostis curvula]